MLLVFTLMHENEPREFGKSSVSSLIRGKTVYGASEIYKGTSFEVCKCFFGFAGGDGAFEMVLACCFK